MKMNVKKMGCILSVLCVLGFGATANADWRFGIGTGIAISSYQGDLGFDSVLAGGPVVLDVDLSPEDFADYAESAFGLGAFATNGRVVFEASFGFLSLEDDPSTTRGNSVFNSDISFDKTQADFTMGYNVIKSENFVLRPYIGVRFIKHEVDAELRRNNVIQLEREIDEDWTDGLIGLAMDVPFGKGFTWGTKFDAGFGGSEGSYYVNSGITMDITKHWFTTLYGQYYAIEYENGNKGDADWYLYDVDEGSGGLKIGYKW